MSVPRQHAQIIRYIALIVVIALGAASLVMVSVYRRYAAELEVRDRSNAYHLRTLMLTHEISTRVDRLERDYPTDDEFGASGSRSDLVTGRVIEVSINSIDDALRSIDELQSTYADRKFEGSVERARIRHASLRGALAERAPAIEVWTALASLRLGIFQLHRLHTIALEETLSEIAATGRRSAFAQALLTIVLVGAACAVILRLFLLVRRRLREHVQTETALRDRERQLQQTQKLEALGTLVGGVAHDFNNLLTAILGYTETVQASLDPTARQHRGLNEVRKAGERAASLTRQLLLFSRQEMLESQVVDLNLLLRDVSPLLKRLLRADISLEVDVGAADLGNVEMDPVQLEQVLMNLAINAQDAMPDGGLLSISTAAVSVTEAEAEQRRMTPGRYSRLRVKDDGSGMTPEVRARVFEPFFTTKERGMGTGLGLSTVHGIVSKSDGFLFLETESGKGCQFDIYLPRCEWSVVEQKTTETPVAVAGSETILVVEDEEQIRELVKEGLEAVGFEVLVASDGEEALRISAEPDRQLDLILSDVVMPGLRGPAVVERVRELHPDIAVVFMSGYNEEGLLHNARSSAAPLLMKPFRLHELTETVREQIDRSRRPPPGEPPDVPLYSARSSAGTCGDDAAMLGG